MNLSYLYANLRLSIAKTAIVSLLEKHDKGIEALSEDITRIIKNEIESNIYLTSTLMDYFDFVDMELENDFSKDQVKEEIKFLLEEINYLLKKYGPQYGERPRAIHFQLPNIIIFEYPSFKQMTHFSIRPRVNRRQNWRPTSLG